MKRQIIDLVEYEYRQGDLYYVTHPELIGLHYQIWFTFVSEESLVFANKLLLDRHTSQCLCLCSGFRRYRR